MSVHVHLCGALRLEIDGEDRTERLRGRQGRLLFAYLVLHRDRPVRRDELVEALWSGDGRPPSDTALAPVLSRLRTALAPAAIDGRDPIRLELGDDAWIDVEAARADPAVAAGLGELVPGLDAPWLTGPRDALLDVRVAALESAGDVASARAAMALAPFRESARAALIRALRATGNLAEALRAYEDVRVLLRDELGTTPGPELLALHGELLDVPAAPAARAPSDLVERDAELGAIAARLDALAAGRGGLVLLEGAAGIGKTRLLAELRQRAAAAGASVRLARASTLERDFGYGVVRQLLDEPADAPAPVRAVFADEATGTAQSGFAALAGLHRLVTAQAAAAPVVLAVDDLQWSDLPSLRVVAYLARRLEDVPVLVAATVRTGEAAADDALLAEIAADPAATALRPGPLTGDATATFVRTRMGAEADPGFAAACHVVTGGNPLLLGQLVSALQAERVPPDADHADEVRAVGPRAVGRTVLLRLARLPGAAVAVARAVAVLGEQPSLALVAALAGVDEQAAADAIAALTRADILRPEADLGFVHPLVRDAVYEELPAAARALEHGRAARLLDERGAGLDAVAAQLLAAAPSADPWVVERLRAAAQLALTRGTPESAITLLTRAADEPPAVEVRGPIILELGSAAEMVRGADAARWLAEARATLTDPVARAEAALRLARMQLFLQDPSEAPRTVAEALAELPDGHQDLTWALEAIRMVCVNFGLEDPAVLERLDRWRGEARGTGPGARCLTGLAALGVAVTAQSAAEAQALALEALEDGTLMDFDPILMIVAAIVALALVDPEAAMPHWHRLHDQTLRRRTLLAGDGLWGPLTLIWLGRYEEAEEWMVETRERQRLWGMVWGAEQAYFSAFMAHAAVARGEVGEGWRRLALTEADQGASDASRFWHASRARLLLADGRPREALADLEHVERTGPPEEHPMWAPWRGLRAQALAALGERDEAVRWAESEVAIARRFGADWATERSLAVLAEVSG